MYFSLLIMQSVDRSCNIFFSISPSASHGNLEIQRTVVEGSSSSKLISKSNKIIHHFCNSLMFSLHWPLILLSAGVLANALSIASLEIPISKCLPTDHKHHTVSYSDFIWILCSAKSKQPPWPQHQQCNNVYSNLSWCRTAYCCCKWWKKDIRCLFYFTESVESGNHGRAGRCRSSCEALPAKDKVNSKHSNYSFHWTETDAD